MGGRFVSRVSALMDRCGGGGGVEGTNGWSVGVVGVGVGE